MYRNHRIGRRSTLKEPSANTEEQDVGVADLLFLRNFVSNVGVADNVIVMELVENAKVCERERFRPWTRGAAREKKGLLGAEDQPVERTFRPAARRRRPKKKSLEDFVTWPAPRSRMPQSRGKLVHARGSPPRRSGRDDSVNRHPQPVNQGFSADRRSKDNQGIRLPSAADRKGKSRMESPPPRKRKLQEVLLDSCSEEDRLLERCKDLPRKPRAWSSGEGSPNDGEEEADEEEEPHGREAYKSSTRPRYKEDGTLIKPVQLDVQGFPHGSMLTSLTADVKKYAKALDPSCSWESQPPAEKYRLFKRMYSDWDMEGQSRKLSEKWIAPLMTKVLINTRFRLNGLIDDGARRPPEVTRDQWETLVKNRRSDASLKKSEHMRSISKGKGSKALQFRAIERDAIIKLSIEHKRAPYALEIAVEVERECQRQEDEKLRGTAERNTDLSDMRARVADMEGTISRLEGKLDASQQRMEDLVHQLLAGMSGNADKMPSTTSPHAPRTVRVDNATSRPPSSAPVLVDIVSSGIQEDEQDLLKLKEEEETEFVNSLFAEQSPDIHAQGVSPHDLTGPSNVLHSFHSGEQDPTDTAKANTDGAGDVSAVQVSEVENSVAVDGEKTQDAQDGEKVMDIGGESTGRGRRPGRSLHSSRGVNLALPAKPMKHVLSKPTTPSRIAAATAKVQLSQPKKFDSTKKK